MLEHRLAEADPPRKRQARPEVDHHRYLLELLRLEAQAVAEQSAGCVGRTIPFGGLLRDSAEGRDRIARALAALLGERA